MSLFNSTGDAAVADPEGAQQAPPKIGSTMFFVFFIPGCIRMLKNEAQIAGESINKP